MTMEFEVKNTSSDYTGRVETMDKTQGSDPDNLADVHILKPGESATLCVWDKKYLVLKEVVETKGSQEKNRDHASNQGAVDTGQGA